jgi:large subunit ribosomal protein L30
MTNLVSEVKGREGKEGDDGASRKSSRGSLLVVNMRGLVNTRKPVRKTLEQLHLLRRFNATIVPDTPAYRGMLKSAKEHLAWYEADFEIVEKLIRSKAESSNGRKVPEEELPRRANYSSLDELARDVASGKLKLDDAQGFRSFFRLKPPRGGFKRSSRRLFTQGGILGWNKELPQMIEKMI